MHLSRLHSDRSKFPTEQAAVLNDFIVLRGNHAMDNSTKSPKLSSFRQCRLDFIRVCHQPFRQALVLMLLIRSSYARQHHSSQRDLRAHEYCSLLPVVYATVLLSHQTELLHMYDFQK